VPGTVRLVSMDGVVKMHWKYETGAETDNSTKLLKLAQMVLQMKGDLESRKFPT